MTGCLDGVRVIEFARFQAGPRSGMMLSDLGAEVIKVERPGGEETRHWDPLVRGQSVYFAVYNRGKKSIIVDLRQPEGLEIVRELVKTADIVLENFKPGTLDRLGLGYDALCELKPGIILVSVSGFGQTGPYREQPGFDVVGQAMTGLMHLTGQREGKPIQTAFSIVDRTTALHATIGALAALRHREATGEGQWVDVCLLDSGYTMVEIPAIYHLASGGEGGESGRPAYEANDGWVTIMAATQQMTQQVVDLLGVTLDAVPGAGAIDSDPVAKAALERWCLERSVDDICLKLTSLGVVAVPVRTVAQAVQDRHLWERELLVKVPDDIAGELHVPGLAIKLSKAPGRVGSVPSAGANTEQILGHLGYDEQKIAELRAAGVVGGSLQDVSHRESASS
jgi:crotonobetainyl-CoA:carnitine CoA-transferase CaiB-like acyl-CoA transferase